MARSPRSKRTVPRPNAWVSLLATMKLARWQLRQTRSLLLVAGIGIVIAVILICTIPLYAQVAISAGIRDSLNATARGRTSMSTASADNFRRSPSAAFSSN